MSQNNPGPPSATLNSVGLRVTLHTGLQFLQPIRPGIVITMPPSQRQCGFYKIINHKTFTAAHCATQVPGPMETQPS